MNNFKLNADNFELTTSKIKVCLANVPSDIKIVDAVLSIKVQSVTTNSEIPVHYSPIESSFSSEGWNNVDNVILSANNILKINISDELQDALLKEAKYLQLTFDDTNIVFAKDSESDFINIDYISLAEFQNNGGNHKINLGKSGQASVDLVTGRLSVTTPIVATDSNTLPLSISANYHSVENEKLPNDIGLPKNWHLNVNQFLIKEDDPDGDLKFTYIDENGKNQIIEEKYAYYKNNTKKYALRKEFDDNISEEAIVCVDLDGNYFAKEKTLSNGKFIFTEYPITKELVSPSGIKLLSSIEKVPGYKQVNYIPEELINVNSQIEKLQKDITDVNDSIEANIKQLCVYAINKEMLTKQLAQQEININSTENQLKLQEIVEQIKQDTLINNRNYRNTLYDAIDNYTSEGKSTNKDDSSATSFLPRGQKFDYNKIKNLYESNPKNAVLGTILASESSLVYNFGISGNNPINIKNTINPDKSSDTTLSYCKGTLQSQYESNNFNKLLYTKIFEKTEFDNCINNILSLYPEIHIDIDTANLWESFKQKLTEDSDSKFVLGYKDLITIDLQLESVLQNHKKYSELRDEYNQLLKKYQHQQKSLESQIPTHYLYNEKNIIYGFGKTLDDNGNETNTYRLILMTDAYENTITINYKSLTSNKIVSITDASNNNILFEYEDSNGYLCNIIDARDRKTSLIYENSLLKEVIHNEETTLFDYDFNHKLQGILSPDGTGAKFTYNNNQVTKVQSVSIIDKIEHNHVCYKANYNIEQKNFLDCLLPDSLISFIYNNYKSTSVTNAQNKVVTYLFDKNGKVRSIYENHYPEDLADFNPEEFNSNVTNYNYDNTNLTFKASKLPYSINYLEDVHFDTGAAIVYKEALSLGSLRCGVDGTPYRYPVYANFYALPNTKEKLSVIVSNEMISKINDISCSHNKSLMLSGWAKADSAFVITDELAEGFPNNIKNRKFEIRADITYIDGSSDSQALQFDWRNTEWQYCALPIVFENKIVAKIECFIDYSNNTNTDMFVFTDLELKQCNYEKTEYNTQNLPVKKSFGHSEWEIYYNYDENKNLICETIASKNTETKYPIIYEYNKNGKLIKSTDYNCIVKENIYNDKGSIIKSLTYHKDEPANILYEEKLLDDKGNETYSLNEFGEKVSKIEYINGSGIHSGKIDMDGTKTTYGYDKHDTLLQTCTTINGNENTNIYGYTLDSLTSLTHNNFDIKYSYDEKGRKTKIQIADTEYLTKTYSGYEEITTLANGESYKHLFDKNGNVLEVYYKAKDSSNYVLIVQNIYDIYGNLVYSKELVNGNENVHTYDYDDFGHVISEENTQHGATVSIENEYDENHSSIDHIAVNIDHTKIEYDYGYSISPDSKLERITSDLGDETISYDKLGRIKNIKLSTLQKEFNYLKDGEHTSNLVSKINFATNDIINDNITYKYDEKGNIVETRQNNKLLTRYKYDALSRIIREDNKEFNTSTTFEYDAGGNILCKKVYAFTMVNNLDFEEPLQNIPYVYPISGWRDQLMSFSGQDIKDYDGLGNPWFYRGNQLKWSHGRQLNKFADIAEFTYNANGIRTSKIANGFTTTYYVNGNKIVRQQDSLNTLDFYYGVDGIVGFHITSKNNDNSILLDQNYYYKKNIQGDIIGIIDSNGEEIIKYVYDAWGNHKAYNAKTGELLDISSYESYINTSNIEQFIAIKNPFRYRSYYYDFETGLYYLNSRYYDPEIGRFINADKINYLEPSYINGLNLYCYCLNQPLKYTDESGNSILVSILIAIGIGALVGAAAYTITYVATGISTNNWSWSLGDFFGSVLGGALAGPLSLLPGGMYISAFASSLFSTILSDAFNSIEDGTDFNFTNSVWTGFVNGFISLAFAGLMGNVFKVQGVNAGRGSWESVTKQIYTKLNKNIINGITIKTFGKMFGLSMYESILDILHDTLFN